MLAPAVFHTWKTIHSALRNSRITAPEFLVFAVNLSLCLGAIAGENNNQKPTTVSKKQRNLFFFSIVVSATIAPLS